MKAKIKGDYVYFSGYTSDEANWLKRKLTWTDKYKKFDNETNLIFVKNEQLCTLSGLLEPLRTLAPFNLEVEANTVTYTRVAVPNDILENITLFDFQVAAVSKALTLKRGIIQSSVGSGKGEMQLAMSKFLLKKGKTGIVIVPSVALADQLKARSLLRGFTEDQVGVFHGKKKESTKPLVIAVANSVYKSTNKVLLDRNFLLIDEAQHSSCDTWLDIYQKIPAEYKVGFSGSPFHEKDDVFKRPEDALTCGITGGVIFKVGYDYLKKLGLISDLYVLFVKLPGQMSTSKKHFSKIYDEWIVNNEIRNRKIIGCINKFKKYNFPVLTLVQRKKHGNDLLLKLKDEKALCVFGNEKSVQYDEYGCLQDINITYNEFKEKYESGHFQTAIATQVFDEGVDIPNIGALVQGGAGRSQIKITQRSGRSIRAKKGVNRAYLIDFIDRGHVYLHAQYKRRKIIYEEMGATIFYDEAEFYNHVFDHAMELNNV